jgi:hypothetical protein
MKKVIITTSAIIMSLGMMSAADLMKVTNIQVNGLGTKVSVVREYDGHVFFTGDYMFDGSLSTQGAVNKVAMLCDSNITAVATSTLGSTTPVKGKVQEFAIARSDAWYKGGITAYMVELARQLDLMR